MKKKTWLLSLVFLISGLLAIFSKSIVKACSWDGESDDNYYSFFDARLAGNTKYYPFFLTLDSYYNESKLEGEFFDLRNEIKVIPNEKAWQDYLGEKTKESDVRALVYASTINELESLGKLLNLSPESVPPRIKQNAALNSLVSKKNSAAINYLIFAKHCEPLVNYPDDWDGWDLPERDTVNMRKMMEKGILGWAESTDEFLKPRYAFQVMRMALYSGFPGEALAIYVRALENGKPDNIISVWALSLKGGAYKKLKRFDEARYVFSQLFDRYYSFMGPFYRENFDLSTPVDGFAKNTLSYCKSNHEKAVVWALDALTYEVSSFSALKEMVILDPASSLTNLILTRHMDWLEHSSPGSKYRNWKNESGNKEINETSELLKNCIERGDLSNPSLWEFCYGYVSFLKHDFVTAVKYVERAKTHSPENSLLKDHIGVLEMLQSVLLVNPGQPDFESIVVTQIQKIESYKGNYKMADVKSYLFQILASKFKEAGYTEEWKTLCLSNTGKAEDLYESPDRKLCEKLIFFLEKPSKTEFEKILVKGFSYSVSDLHDIIGTTYMADRDFENAVHEFELAGDSKILPADPFLVHIRDCHDCDFEAAKDRQWTKGEFASRMLELKKNTGRKTPDMAPAKGMKMAADSTSTSRRERTGRGRRCRPR